MNTVKVKVNYFIPVEEVIEMSCEDYCYFYANHTYKNFIPKDARYVDFNLESKEDEGKMLDFYFEK